MFFKKIPISFLIASFISSLITTLLISSHWHQKFTQVNIPASSNILAELQYSPNNKNLYSIEVISSNLDQRLVEASAAISEAKDKFSVSNEQTLDFISAVNSIPSNIQGKMIGVTWKAGCPITLDNLRLLEVSYWNDNDQITQGQLVVAYDAVEPLRTVFAELFRIKFPIHSMRPAYEFGGDDQQSMAANNTSAFNCRSVEGTSTWSQHAYGKAIDINPLVNPYIKNGVVLPPEGKPYLDRDPEVKGLIGSESSIIGIFAQVGWSWGGYWNSLKDYQHFSHNGM